MLVCINLQVTNEDLELKRFYKFGLEKNCRKRIVSEKKIFSSLFFGVNVTKLFPSSRMLRLNKLDCLTLASLCKLVY